MSDMLKTNTLNDTRSASIFSLRYWQEATKNMTDIKMLCYASIIIALRIAVKFIKIPIDLGVEFSFDCYVNSLGSLVYGPVMGLAVGAISDTLGCILHPSGPYFFPFIFTEMLSSFIFGIFLWKRSITPPRVLLSKFTVNLTCNIILTSLLMKPYMRLVYGKEYNFINLTRIAKNLVLFPLEAMLITIIVSAMIPPLKSLKMVDKGQESIKLRKKDVVLMLVLTALSVGLVLFYVLWLKDFIAAHNIKLF